MPSGDSFVQRLLEVSVRLDPNSQSGQPISFAGTGLDTTTMSGFRVAARISNSGAPAGSNATVMIWGMDESRMNQLSSLGLVYDQIARNTLTLSAGDAETGLTSVFSGTIFRAYPDYNSSPSVPFRFECQSGLFDNIAPAAASSFPGSTNVADIMAGFARQMELGFENNGVNVQMSNAYYAGNLEWQMRQLAEDAGIIAERVAGNTILAIWPKGGSRTSVQTIPLISKDTGMIGYPTVSANGYVEVRMLFNPQVAFGGRIRVDSRIPTANKTWTIYGLDLALDSQVPNGQWMMIAQCYPEGLTNPLPPR